MKFSQWLEGRYEAMLRQLRHGPPDQFGKDLPSGDYEPRRTPSQDVEDQLQLARTADPLALIPRVRRSFDPLSFLQDLANRRMPSNQSLLSSRDADIAAVRRLGSLLSGMAESQRTMFLFIAGKNPGRIVDWAQELDSTAKIMMKLAEWKKRKIL
jgi:hypothetical protein